MKRLVATAHRSGAGLRARKPLHFPGMRGTTSAASQVRDWIDGRAARSFFVPADVPGGASVIESTLSRLASDPDGPILRVRNGLYWKKPPATRWGTGRPDPVDAVFAVAGRGAGLAGASAANALGLSTQVPVVPMVAVLGRPPKGIDGVRVTTRSNVDRVDLNHTEVAVLEALRDFPHHVDVDADRVRRVLRGLVANGRIDIDKVCRIAVSDRKPEVRTILSEAAA